MGEVCEGTGPRVQDASCNEVRGCWDEDFLQLQRLEVPSQSLGRSLAQREDMGLIKTEAVRLRVEDVRLRLSGCAKLFVTEEPSSSFLGGWGGGG